MAREQTNENEKVKIVGIVGLGGSGKTTLAKEFYNRKRSSFNGSSFLSDVRDASTRNALPSLQSKLLEDVLHVKGCKIDSVSEGKGIVRDRLKSSSGASPIYKIKRLNPEHARELFCMHAFQQPTPRLGFEILVVKFCEKCGGLPLFLKVTGAHLRAEANNDKDDWEYELQQIHDDIRSILDVSFNTLHKEEKQIFLDIACFFLGEDKSLAIRVWDTSEGKGSHRRLKNLQNKCLLEFDDQNRFRMHDHVRDFGRGVAQDESPCRIWNEDQAVNCLQQQKRAIETRGIVAATSYGSIFSQYFRYSYCQSSYQPPLEEIEMSALKLLVFKGDGFDEQFGKRSKNLIWLRWFDYPHTSISPWLISMRYLTVLQIFGGNLKEWQLCDEQVHLRELRIRRTKLCELSIPQHVCPRLEHLDLGGNMCLIEVKDLPTQLVNLCFRRCEALKRISAILDLTNLQVFDISYCCKLQELPNLQHLRSLETLHVSHCSKLKNIQGLEQLTKLRDLDLSGCSELHELPNLQHLSSLEKLSAWSCNKVWNIQGLGHLAKLRGLHVSGCSELHELPNLQHLSSLEKLSVCNCNKLRNIQGLENLAKLRDLHVSGYSELHELPNLQYLSSLEKLRVWSFKKLWNIQGLEHLAKLRDLDVSGCCELYELSNLQGLSSLEKLSVWNCNKLWNIQGLEHLAKPRDLDLGGCSELHELSNLQHLSSLEKFDVSDCSKLKNIQGLEHLAKLRSFHVSGCFELLELPSLQHLSSLEKLSVCNCNKLRNIQGLEHLTKLQDLDVSGCFESATSEFNGDALVSHCGKL